MPRQVEAVRSAVGLARDLGRARLLVCQDPERQQQERAGDEEQQIDGDDRADRHSDTLSKVTSTKGFLPVHKVAQRRTASRTASRIRSSSAPGSKARAAASVASARKSSRSTSTGTPNGRTSGAPASS